MKVLNLNELDLVSGGFDPIAWFRSAAPAAAGAVKEGAENAAANLSTDGAKGSMLSGACSMFTNNVGYIATAVISAGVAVAGCYVYDQYYRKA